NTLAVGSNAVLKIELHFGGLVLATSDSTVRGLVINSFSGNAIEITGPTSMRNNVLGNYLGTNVAGEALTDWFHGGGSQDGPNNLVGGAAPADRNVFGGTRGYGVYIDHGSFNCIEGNYIGTNAQGTAALGDGDGVGVFLYESDNNTVGGTAAGAGNVIS